MVVRYLEPVDGEGARNTTLFTDNATSDPVADVHGAPMSDTASILSKRSKFTKRRHR